MPYHGGGTADLKLANGPFPQSPDDGDLQKEWTEELAPGRGKQTSAASRARAWRARTREQNDARRARAGGGERTRRDDEGEPLNARSSLNDGRSLRSVGSVVS